VPDDDTAEVMQPTVLSGFKTLWTVDTLPEIAGRSRWPTEFWNGFWSVRSSSVARSVGGLGRPASLHEFDSFVAGRPVRSRAPAVARDEYRCPARGRRSVARRTNTIRHNTSIRSWTRGYGCSNRSRRNSRRSSSENTGRVILDPACPHSPPLPPHAGFIPETSRPSKTSIQPSRGIVHSDDHDPGFAPWDRRREGWMRSGTSTFPCDPLRNGECPFFIPPRLRHHALE
jgi:hypothetical protein